MLDKARDLEESVDGDAGNIPEAKPRGGLFRHPGRDRQAATVEPDAERAPRLLVDRDRTKPLADQGMERVQDDDDPITGIVDDASPGGEVAHSSVGRMSSECASA
jgi:hypothetical protein